MDLLKPARKKANVTASTKKRPSGKEGKNVAKRNESNPSQGNQILKKAFSELWASIEGSKGLFLYWTLANFALMVLSLVTLSILYVVALLFVNHFTSLAESLNYVGTLTSNLCFQVGLALILIGSASLWIGIRIDYRFKKRIRMIGVLLLALSVVLIVSVLAGMGVPEANFSAFASLTAIYLLLFSFCCIYGVCPDGFDSFKPIRQSAMNQLALLSIVITLLVALLSLADGSSLESKMQWLMRS